MLFFTKLSLYYGTELLVRTNRRRKININRKRGTTDDWIGTRGGFLLLFINVLALQTKRITTETAVVWLWQNFSLLCILKRERDTLGRVVMRSVFYESFFFWTEIKVFFVTRTSRLYGKRGSFKTLSGNLNECVLWTPVNHQTITNKEPERKHQW